MISITDVRGLIILHEGLRLKPYTDTVGKTTIGVGRNLTDKGLSFGEAETLFTHDLEEHEMDLVGAYPWVLTLDAVRYAVMVDMAFNLGISRLSGFRVTLSSVEGGDYQQAAKEMLRSKWARQVKTRAVRLSQMMASGEWPIE